MTNKNLLETLTILERYVDPDDRNYHCEHDVLHICVDVEDINAEDLVRLRELSCIAGEHGDGLQAFVSC